MSFDRSFGAANEPDRGEPVSRQDGTFEERRSSATSVVAVGTLACPSCDAPVLPDGPLSPAEPLTCPVCAHAGRVRDFLSLGAPTRPARVVVRLVTGRAAISGPR